MKKTLGFLGLVFAALFLSGCVVSHFKDSKGRECTRGYFTFFGVAGYSCSVPEAGAAAAAADRTGETELKIAPAGQAVPTASRTLPGKAIEQNIKATTRVR
ncbi:MAG TPA: hypothetical protein PKI45_09015 [Candidatus Omnitrophota bacterium]|nr:hypothetical protein [Candidatus Omnitrophota bacterium]